MAIAGTVAGMTACEGALGLDAGVNGNLVFSVERVNSGLLGLGSSSPNEVSSGGHTVVINSATMTASDMELRGADAGSGTDSIGNATTSRFEKGPITVDLPVQGGTSRNVTASIASGTYDRFEMTVRTVRMKGTYDGAPFDVTANVSNDLEMHLLPPLVVARGAESTAVTVALDIQSWFRNAAGGLLDPRQASNDSGVQAALRANIRSSFRATQSDGQ